jgi:hypothetical protein
LPQPAAHEAYAAEVERLPAEGLPVLTAQEADEVPVPFAFITKISGSSASRP